MYYIVIAIGLRRGELVGLKWGDIDFENRTISVKRQVLRIDSKVVESPLKTKSSYRVISIGTEAVDVLREQQKKTAEIKSDYIFTSPNGTAISPDSVLDMLHRVLKQAGLPKLRFHDLSHS